MNKKMRNTDNEEDLREAFTVLDRDGDGKVTPEELRHVMINLGMKLTDEEIKEIVRDADVDKDGKISSDEFVRLMMGK